MIGNKAQSAPVPARPTGVPKAPDPTVDAYYGGPKLDTITEYKNELGQTVYSISASHFDVSPPLRDLAAAATANQAAEAEENEPPISRLPESRIVRSDVPDPVVQPVVQQGDSSLDRGVPLAAPTTGFNFLGVGVLGASPSDSNGSVGGNQFVETVNTRYQVWSLNRSTQVATSVLGPVNINTLWSGFGGVCESQNSGDPIVIFDKTAKRWLISQFTTNASAGVYYQCVAVSQTTDATGAYGRWAFAVPSGLFGDYPHISAWPNAAYFMMAHGSSGGSVTAIFAAMDRTKMLAANPTATWVVILDPAVYGHMPADQDGFALPPTLAPGIFVSMRSEGMYIYRMKVNFVSPGTSTKTLQAIVPVAPWAAACGGGTCIPQPGAGPLDAISDRLMFRAAYRNFIDHESLVVSHSVDPSVGGVASGVRWYDIRLSGPPDPACPAYPCLYQQGTIADAPFGRSRWMSSIAMDTAENILVGYSTTGTTNGTDNHSSRYTGRAKDDPPGTMTVPESTIITGTANNTASSRWGDYHSMSSDPADDCTFWFVSQYYTTTNQWSTRIASAVFPPGTGAGQCPVTTCVTRPGLQPTGLAATTPGDNQITLNWNAVTPTPGGYAIERAEGTCGTEGLYKPLAAVPSTSTTYADMIVQGGITYSYRVRSTADAAGKCQALLASPCVDATATGHCTLKPSFAGAGAVADSQQSNCGLTVSWTPAVSGCPLTPSMRYNIFRGTTPDFVPSVANRIATCVVSSSFLDTNHLQSGTTYYYVVRAEDSSTGNGGGCAGGNEDANSVVATGTPYGAGNQPSPFTWTDGGGDGNSLMLLNVAGGGNTLHKAWRFVTTTSDPDANHTPGGAYAYRNAGPAPGDVYAHNVCAELQSPPVFAAGASINLQYWERHQSEYHYDGTAVEYSRNGGAWTDVPAPSNSVAAGCSPADDTTGWEPLTCAGGNACGYGSTKVAFSGPLAGGSACADFATSATVTPYAHRCHQITGLSPDDNVRFRWRFGSDGGAEFAGFYLDDIAVTNVRRPNACVPDTCAGQSNGTSCDDGNFCTTGETCTAGACGGGTPNPPGELVNSRFTDKVTFQWDSVPNSPSYDILRGEVSALPVGPGFGDEFCFDNVGVSSLSDGTTPLSGQGFWYLVRAETLCGVGTYGTQKDLTPRISTTCP